MKQGNLIVSGKHSKLLFSFLQDQTLSYKELGLLAFLITVPETQFVTEKWLTDQTSDGLGSVRSGLKELEKKGYLERKPIRYPNGQLKGTTWFIQLPKKQI